MLPAASAGPPAPTSPLAATAASPAVAPSPPPIPPSKARPPAPEVSFTKRREAAPPAEPPLPLEQTANSWPTVTCQLCGSTNKRGVRYCITCGQLLGAPDESGGNRIGAIELLRTVVDVPAPEMAAVAAPPIAPARVIDVGAVALRPDQRFCPRCRGACDSAAQFCRFCGLLLLAPTTPSNAVVELSPALPPSLDASPARLSSSAAPHALPGHARLVLITRDGTEGATYTLGASSDLGRIEGHVLFPDDQCISPRHARIVERGGAFFVRDLESTNGVFMRIPFIIGSDPAYGIKDDRSGGDESGGDRSGGDRSGGNRSGGNERDDKTTMRGHHSQAISEPRSEQPLADQELFLVGQQVLRFEVVKQAEEAFGAASENGTLLFGTPAAPRYARLSQRTVEGVVRDVFHLRRAETVIGRESGDIVFTDDPFLSRRHAVLRMHGGAGPSRRFTLADLGSSNGTFLRIRDEVRLRHGDHFRIGQQLLRFDIGAVQTGV